MRTDLNNSTFKLTPNLVNKTETKTVEIPFETKREFNPKLQPRRAIKQEGQPEVRQSHTNHSEPINR